jgi:hypothetical protein
MASWIREIHQLQAALLCSLALGLGLADAMKRKTRSCICGPNEPWVLQFVLERQLEYSILKIGLIIISDIQVEISVESMMVA